MVIIIVDIGPRVRCFIMLVKERIPGVAFISYEYSGSCRKFTFCNNAKRRMQLSCFMQRGQSRDLGTLQFGAAD